MTDTPQQFDSATTPAKPHRSRRSRPNVAPPGGLTQGIPEAEFDIRIADGPEGEMLADLQARVLWEITKWQQGQNNSETGHNEAA